VEIDGELRSRRLPQIKKTVELELWFFCGQLPTRFLVSYTWRCQQWWLVPGE
jgi:hypothetical protein